MNYPKFGGQRKRLTMGDAKGLEKMYGRKVEGQRKRLTMRDIKRLLEKMYGVKSDQ